MRFTVLAMDYDGTIARDSVLGPEMRRAIEAVRGRGITVVIVTGRILSELRRVAGDLRFVDAVVAENGAVVAFPETGQSVVLASRAPQLLVQELRSRHVPVDVGECIIEADASFKGVILEAIRKLELPQVIVFNRDRLMVLPSGVNKSTGLREALRNLRLSPHNAIGIGDAENDHDLLDTCELGVAVEWGSESLKARADEILQGHGPEAVARWMTDAAQQPRLTPDRVGRRQLVLGHDLSGKSVALDVRGRNLLVIGDPKSGKSWIAGLLCEQLILHRYSLCIIDPEGEYSGLEVLPGVVVLRGSRDCPTPRSLHTALKYPDVNVVLDLSRMPHASKWSYIQTVLPALAELRYRYGTPHRIVLDEAHHFLNDTAVNHLIDFELAGYTLITYQPSRLHPAVLAASEAVITTRLTDARERNALTRWCTNPDEQDSIARLELGQAAILPTVSEAAGKLKVFRASGRMAPHVRHQHKYLDVPVPCDRAFVFTLNMMPTGKRATNLREMVDVVEAEPMERLSGHVSRNDFSRWIADVFGDDALASELHEIEEQYELGLAADANDQIASAIEARYELSHR
jgi:hydroxymethylpyrimidine pyrophosphatase-like HAD family hydrolase